MKKHLASALSLICAAVMITSCSNEKDPVIPGSSLESATFTTSENLVLTVDGVAATAQTASFTPSADGTASITLKGENLDLEGLFGAMSVSDDASALSFPTSCVIPGSAQASFTVTLSGSADKPTFTGSSETEYCTFAYSGEVSKDEMTLVLSDIKLKNTSLAATFSTGDFNDNFFNTLRVEWVSEKGIELAPNFEMPVKDILRMALVLPLIPQGEDGNSVSVAAMIPELLKNVTFGADGSVTARYADTDEEGMPVKESPKGLARYVVKNDNTLLLFLDPQAIIANTLSVASKSRSVDFSTVLQGLMTQVVPMLVNGVPVNYGPRIADEEYEAGGVVSVIDPDPNAVSFYLGTDVLLPLLKTVAPVLSDEEIIEAIKEAASQDPDMAEKLPGILRSLPGVINTTTKVEIGINLYK